LAEALLAEVDELLKTIPDYEQAIKSSAERAAREGKSIIDTIIQDMITKFIITSVNEIIGDISKEGISLPKLGSINVAKGDPATLSVVLKIGR